MVVLIILLLYIYINHLQKDARQFSYRTEEVEKDFNKTF